MSPYPESAPLPLRTERHSLRVDAVEKLYNVQVPQRAEFLLQSGGGYSTGLKTGCADSPYVPGQAAITQ